MKYDIVIIGSGPGGYVAAIRAAQLGFETAVIERESLGGICLNWGCIPTKALLRSADLYRAIVNANSFGLDVKNQSAISFDIENIIKRSRKVSKKLNNGVEYLLKKNNVDVIYGEAKFLTGDTLEVIQDDNEKKRIVSPHIIIATGARPKELPSIPIDHKIVWDYRDAMTAKEIPKSLLIIGSGAIGMEFANFYATFGCEVTVMEIADRILLSEDHEISELAAKSFAKMGINIMTSTHVVKIEAGKNKIKVTMSDNKGNKTEKLFHRILSAVGVIPNTESLGLENLNVSLNDNGHIDVDSFMATKHQGIYAIGDVTSMPMLAHKASHQAVVCVEKIANLPNVHGIKRENIPGCIYTFPQIASVGLTEEQASKEGYNVRIGKFPFTANGKAMAMEETEGMIKLIFEDRTGEILGAHMIGSEVTEMISTLVLAKTAECTDEEIINTIFPHPTLSEAIHEATLAAQKRPIHI